MVVSVKQLFSQEYVIATNGSRWWFVFSGTIKDFKSFIFHLQGLFADGFMDWMFKEMMEICRFDVVVSVELDCTDGAVEGSSLLGTAQGGRI